MRIALDRHIEITDGVRGGKPRIAGTRIAVADIALWHLHDGRPLAEIAADYSLPLAAVHAAMAYYYDHQHEVDATTEADAAFVAARTREGVSRVRAKLRAATDA